MSGGWYGTPPTAPSLRLRSLLELLCAPVMALFFALFSAVRFPPFLLCCCYSLH